MSVLSMKTVTPESQSLAVVEIIPLGHQKKGKKENPVLQVQPT